MTVFLDSTGFKPKTLVELRQELEASYRAVWGSSVDLSPEGPLGQHIGLTSKMLADLWEGAQEIYTARDPDTATGVALDEICAETGITRLPPTAARADGVLCWMAMATAVTIPAGSRIQATSAVGTYSLESDVVGTVSTTVPRIASRLKITISDGGTMYVAVGTYSPFYATYSVATHTNVQNFVDTVFAPLVTTAIVGSTCKYTKINGVEYVEFVFPTPLDMGAVVLGLSIGTDSMQGFPGSFVSDTPGAASVPSLHLDSIATPVSGWLGISQYAEGTAGADTETDMALRLRRLSGMRSGTGTEDAIYNAVLRVPGVSYAKVVSNRDLNTDPDGRPGKSLECIVQGGEKQAVATAIWQTAPAGVWLYGSFVGTDIPSVTGADGKQHPVNFSVPQAVFAWVRVIVSGYNPEESAPADITSAIQAAIVSWGQANMGLGDNMVRQKFYGPVYTVSGIAEVSITHAITTTAGGTPSYTSAAQIAVSARQYASFALGQVVVVFA